VLFRSESATRQTGDDVLITETTLRLLASANGHWAPRPPVALKGKAEPIALFAPSG